MSDNKNTSEKNTGKKPSGGGMGKPKFGFSIYWIYAVIALIFIGLQFFGNFGNSAQELNMKEFLEMVSAHEVKEVQVVNETFARITIREDALQKEKFSKLRERGISKDANPAGPHYVLTIGPADKFEEKLQLAQTNLPEEEKLMVDYVQQNNMWEGILGWLIPIGLMVVIWIFIFRRMGGGGGGAQIFNIGKSRAKLFDKDAQVAINFNDVAGLDEAKVELNEIVDFLKNPKKYTTLGGKIPRGALLVGPPGTGKTLLAKAVAGEAKVPFFSLSGSDFVEMFVGVGASRVRDLFKQAKEKAPCIVFIDEIDAIGRARGRSVVQGANDERENTLNQLLTEMDGFESNNGVIILAATNRVDVLDKALIRPGRFDRQIMVDLPDLIGRKAIFKVHTRNLKIAPGLDLELLAKQTPGFSGADIANVCNEAALIAARSNKTEIDRQDFNNAIDRVIGGLEKKNKIVSLHEKKVIAYHEAGHATVSWFLRYASPLVKVTIVPRGQSLGAAWYLPEERQITTTEQIMDDITATLGGRAAEELVFGKVSTGALSDLEKVTKQAYAMVTIYGLNDKIGNLSYYDSSGQSDYSFSKPYSEATAVTIDQEVKRISDIAYSRAKEILTTHKDQLLALAEKLVEKEVIYREDLEELFGQRPYEEERKADQYVPPKKEEAQEEVKPSENPETESKPDVTGQSAEENTSASTDVSQEGIA
jgi:ATP-dependent metalloprotease FtsH